MKRFIRYLYEYQDGKRTRNTGFVKVEEQEDAVVIQIYGRGFPPAEGRILKIYLFYEEGGQCIGIFMGEIHGTQAAFGYKLRYTPEDVGGSDRFRRIQGIILRTGKAADAGNYGATWKDDFADSLKMIPEEEWKQSMQNGESKERIEQEDTVQNEKTENQNEENEQEQIPNVSEEDIMQKGGQQEEPEIQQKDVIYKITRQELAGLPRKEWKLANNHFLLHGYYNYHHLVSFKKEGKYWLGVPGLYFPGEQRAAAAFGFGQFMKPAKEELNLEEYKIEDEERFGYWCRPVGAVIRKETKEKKDAENIDRGRKIYERGDQTGEEGVED